MGMKLSVEKVVEIYKLSSTYSLSLAQIAKKFGVSTTSVVAIRDKKFRKDTIEFYENMLKTLPPIIPQMERQLEDIKNQAVAVNAAIPILKKEIRHAKRKSARAV